MKKESILKGIIIGVIVTTIGAFAITPLRDTIFEYFTAKNNKSVSIQDFVESKTHSFSIVDGKYNADVKVDILKAYRGIETQSVTYPDQTIANLPHQPEDTLVIPFQVNVKATVGSGEKYLRVSLQQDSCYINFYYSKEGARYWEDEEYGSNNARGTLTDDNLWESGNWRTFYGYIAVPSFYDSTNPNGNPNLVFDYMNISIGFDSLEYYDSDSKNGHHTYPVSMLKSNNGL